MSFSRAAYALLGIVAVALQGCQSIPKAISEPTTAAVFVVRRAWHIDIGFASTDLQPPLRSLLQAFPGANYLEFGFGDRHYLLTQGHGPGNLLLSVWPGKGLVSMTALRATPQEAFGAAHVVKLAITPAAAGAIQAFVWGSLSASGAGAPSPVADGPYPGSVFYAATAQYSGFHTCNTWAAQALHAGGLSVHSTGVLFAGQLWSQVRRLTPQGAGRLTVAPDSPAATAGRVGCCRPRTRSSCRCSAALLPSYSFPVGAHCCC